MKTSTVLACLLTLASAASAQAQYEVLDRTGSATVSRTSGGPVKITRGLSVVSARSSLELEWIMVTDSSMGLVFSDPVGASGTFDSPWFRYRSDMRMAALKDITAFEVRLITFNVWNEFTGTLAFTQLEDLKPGQKKAFDRVWGYLSESEIRDHLTSIAYIARVKLKDGTVVLADPTPALKAAQRIKSNITLQDLEPRIERQPGTATM